LQPLILQIETATSSCSVALAKNGETVAARCINERNIHAEVITLFIEEIMAKAGVSFDDLDAVAVSCGPGSYTGLRIGVSTAKGLCYAADKPLIAVPTLEAMAHGALADFDNGSYDLLCPMIDARRMEVYTGVFDKEGERLQSESAEIITADSFSGFLRVNRLLFFGDGAAKCKPVLSADLNALFFENFVNNAEHLSKIALKKFLNGEFEDVAYFEPYYLKDFIAGKKVI
jgi:tRNA threonylcarbamoyladenosine biosynthesis protein TsaB